MSKRKLRPIWKKMLLLSFSTLLMNMPVTAEDSVDITSSSDNVSTIKQDGFNQVKDKQLQAMYLTSDTPVLQNTNSVASTLEVDSKGTLVHVSNVKDEKAEIITPSGKIGYVPVEQLTDNKNLIFNNVVETKYVKEDGINAKAMPADDSDTVATLNKNDEIHIVGRNDSGYVQVSLDNGNVAYIKNDNLMDEKEIPQPVQQPALQPSSSASVSSWNGAVLSPSAGAVQGPSGKETYYNLNMSGCVSIMRGLGNNDNYWVRDDGVKMLGNYVMCAANLAVHPRGSLVESSLGTAIVVDTGGFASRNPTQLDIAVAW